MKKFGYIIFISAFLLFLIQPMIARYILPWFGGSAAVWSTCMLFFQFGLLLGYGYSHLLVRSFVVSKQIWIHLSLLALSLLFIPIIPKEWLKPEGFDNPVSGIIKLLALTVGFPYVMVSSTAPLMQHWFTLHNPKKSPYRLYALSNFASLLGLFSYPILIEPIMKLKTQTWFWSIGYLFFIAISLIVALNMRKIKIIASNNKIKNVQPVKLRSKILWLLFSFLGTAILLSFTNKLTQDTVVVPFLWILPLSFYLLSFIIAFEKPLWYKRFVFIPLALLLVFIVLRTQLQLMEMNTPINPIQIIFIYCSAVLAIFIVLHCELSRSKPDESHLTLFYLLISVGGILGGIFVNIIAPIVFNSYWEIYVALLTSVIAVGYTILSTGKLVSQKRISIFALSIAVFAGISIAFGKEYQKFEEKNLIVSRNFYGVLKVTEEKNREGNAQRTFTYGTTVHGIELMDSAHSNFPFTYYSPLTGIGLTLTNLQAIRNSENQNMHVGIIGLGIGTLFAYGRAIDTYKYYEINPEVEVLAKKYFKYFENFKGKSEVIIGDGRISLERELKEKGSNNFDVIVVDAFSDDVIPAHLLTKEAIELYFAHLKKDGVLTIHITNSNIDLMPVICGITDQFKIPFYYIIKQSDSDNPVGSLWVLYTLNKKFLTKPDLAPFLQTYDIANNPIEKWTDDHSSILSLIRME